MKLTRTFILSLAISLSFAMLVACSNDTEDESSPKKEPIVPSAEQTISLEDTSLLGELMYARFVGAHTAYITMYDSSVSKEENLYTYSATADTLTLTLRKIASPDGSGVMLTQDEYISWWKSDNFRLSNIIKEDISSWFQTETFTVTATDGTVYTFTNKTNYTVNDGETTSFTTTSAKSKTSGGSESALFSDVSGYAVIESEYSASEFTNVVTVNVNSTGYQLKLVGAAVGESVSGIGSEDEDTQKAIKEREEVFDLLYNKYSANDWALVKAEFKPYLFSYEKNKTVTESYIGENDNFETMDVTYDYYLTQHYSAPENAIFLYGDDVSETEMTIAVFSGLRGSVSTVSAGETKAIYETIPAATTSESLTFVDTSLTNNGETVETISARYSLHEDGDNTTLTLNFETKAGFAVSGKTITMKYSPVCGGLMLTD